VTGDVAARERLATSAKVRHLFEIRHGGHLSTAPSIADIQEAFGSFKICGEGEYPKTSFFGASRPGAGSCSHRFD